MRSSVVVVALLGSGGPTVAIENCPEFDPVALRDTLELELGAEPGVGAALEPGSVTVECGGESLAIVVQTAGEVRRRTISASDRAAFSERTLALAIAPLFGSQPATVPEPDVPEPANVPTEIAQADVSEPAPPVSSPEPTSELSETAAAGGGKPPSERAQRIAAPANRSSVALVVRPSGHYHDAPGVGGQLGVLVWPTRRFGLSGVATARWGRATRDRGRVDTLVAGAGPGFALQLGAGRLRFRADLSVAVVYARLAGRSNRMGTAGGRSGRVAVDVGLGVGAQVCTPRLCVVPQMIAGITPGAPVGTVSGERDVSLLIPYVGIGVSLEPWLRVGTTRPVSERAKAGR